MDDVRVRIGAGVFEYVYVGSEADINWLENNRDMRDLNS